MDQDLVLSQSILRKGFQETDAPLNYVDEIQQKHAPQLKSCEPVLGFLEQLGFKRFSLYRALYEKLKSALEKELESSPRETLGKLLLETLSFLTFQPLEDIPISIFKVMPNPPDVVLEKLSHMDSTIFEKLPRHARQQLWERHPESFQTHIAGLIDAYVEDVGTMRWSEEIHPDKNIPHPHRRRKYCKPLQDMTSAIGSSPRLYRFFVDEVRERFVKTNNTRFCDLRVDLLMAMHDIQALSVLKVDPCHDFAWNLDTYVKQIFARVTEAPMDMKTAQLQKNVVNELLKLLGANYRPDLGSAFESSFQQGGMKSGSVGGSGGNKMNRAGLGGGRASMKKVVDLTTVLLDALRKIRSLDRQKLFWKPVIESYPQLEKAYLAKVSTPMDLETVEGKIRKGKYNSVDDMRVDLHQIADNSREFNGPSHKITETADMIMKVRAESLLIKARTTLEQARIEQQAAKRLREKEEKERAALEVKEAAEASKQPQLSEEELRKKREKEEEERILKERMEEDERLMVEEKKTRYGRTLSDSAMILASGFTVNALTIVLWYLLGEEVIKKEVLPRDAPLTRNICWLLEVAGKAHELTSTAQRAEPISIMELTPTADKVYLPAFANMLLESCDFRAFKPGDDTRETKELLEEDLLKWCDSSWLVRNTVLHFFCDRVCRKDLAMVRPLLNLISELKDKATNHSGFLYSLVTSFFWSAIKPVPGSSKGGMKRSPSHLYGSSRVQMPPLPAEVFVDAIKNLFLPAVLEVAPLSTDKFKTARMHYHLVRLLTLDITSSSVSQTELLHVCRAAILSLAGTVDDPLKILGSAELKDVIYQRYCDPSFHQAQKQYEKLFRKFTGFRAQCGLPPLMVGQRGSGLPSPSPSPFITPSPSPSPLAPSQFYTNSPGVGPESSNASNTSSNPNGSPRKRALELMMEEHSDAAHEAKKSRTESTSSF